MTETASNLACFAVLTMTENLYLSLRDLCQQDVMDEKGRDLAKVVAISNLGVAGKLRYLSKD
jgi:hypothetical protein